MGRSGAPGCASPATARRYWLVCWIVTVTLVAAGMARSGVAAAAGVRPVPVGSTEIAYSCQRAPGLAVYQLCAVPGNGGAPRVLWTTASDGEFPVSLSPDGRRAVYTSEGIDTEAYWDVTVTESSQPGGPWRNIWRMPGCGQQDSCEYGVFPGLPAWNPAGTELAVAEPSFVGTKAARWFPGSCQIWLMGAEGQRAHVLRKRAGQPLACRTAALAWSPDGKRLAFVDAAGLAVVTVRTGKVVTLAKLPPDSPLLSLAWSPAGDTIVATSGQGYELERFDATTGRERTLLGTVPPAPRATVPAPAPTPVPSTGPSSPATSSAPTEPVPIQVTPVSPYYQSVLFSPDGRYLAVETEDSQGACTIETVHADGSHLAILVSPGLNCEVSAWIRTPQQ